MIFAIYERKDRTRICIELKEGRFQCGCFSQQGTRLGRVMQVRRQKQAEDAQRQIDDLADGSGMRYVDRLNDGETDGWLM